MILPPDSSSTCDSFAARLRAAERLCARHAMVDRRAVLSAGAAGLLSGLSFSQTLAGDSLPVASQVTGFGKAKRCLLLFMWGGPSQLDTLDPKTNAPSEVRGEFSAILTATPGLQICEHFRNLAPLTDLVTVIRSLNHDDPAHLSSAHTAMTGQLPPVNKSDAEPPSRDDSPQLGALLSKFRNVPVGLPSSVTMPWKTFHPAAPGGESPGQSAGWLANSVVAHRLQRTMQAVNITPSVTAASLPAAVSRAVRSTEPVTKSQSSRPTIPCPPATSSPQCCTPSEFLPQPRSTI